MSESREHGAAGTADGAAWAAGLDVRAAEAFTRASALVTPDRLVEVISRLVGIPSPTGDEAPLAIEIARMLGAGGIQSETLPIDDRQANAWGRLKGSGDGPSVMFYSPLDTVTTGNPDEDSEGLRSWDRDLAASPYEPWPGVIAGLGASNPKGHAACMIVAAEALAQSEAPLGGDVLFAFGAGGMPSNAREPSSRRNVGHGVGADFLLENGIRADYAVVAKPGWSVTWEEPGLTWFDVTVGGGHTYVGARHRLPYDNPIVTAGRVIERLEAWFPEYSLAHTDGGVAPQGMVTSIRGGWQRTAAFTPDHVTFRVDLRVNPRSTIANVEREFRARVASIAHDLTASIDVRLVLAIPGAGTAEDSWIIRSSVAAWEAFAGTPHVPERALSGSTDANILRRAGIPTARVGMPKVVRDGREVGFGLGMNSVAISDALRLTRILIRIALDTSIRSDRHQLDH